MGLVSGVRTAQAGSVRAPDPAASYVTGIDVSHHQSEIDFEAVRDDGHRFVICLLYTSDAADDLVSV